jgi:predicted metal-dependent hydrolase
MLDSIPFEIKKSSRSRSLRITVRTDASVLITQPTFVSDEAVRIFVDAKRSWIEKAVAKYKSADILQIPKANKRDFDKYKREAKLLVLEKLRIFNEYYKSPFGSVTIKNQKSRWGSCSRHKNLNFNYRIIFLPEHLQDYLVVHELCHTKVFNHSRNFWALVEEKIPRATIAEFKRRVV